MGKEPKGLASEQSIYSIDFTWEGLADCLLFGLDDGFGHEKAARTTLRSRERRLARAACCY